jgi:hypothetical protein
MGDAQRVGARIREHLDAGADHVCIQILVPDGADLLPLFAELATVLLD